MANKIGILNFRIKDIMISNILTNRDFLFLGLSIMKKYTRKMVLQYTVRLFTPVVFHRIIYYYSPKGIIDFIYDIKRSLYNRGMIC